MKSGALMLGAVLVVLYLATRPSSSGDTYQPPPKLGGSNPFGLSDSMADPYGPDAPPPFVGPTGQPIDPGNGHVPPLPGVQRSAGRDTTTTLILRRAAPPGAASLAIRAAASSIA